MSDDNVNGTYLPVRGTQTGRISDALWEQIEPLLPPELPIPRAGRPRMDNRKAMEAIFYVLRNNCAWKALPRSLGAKSTVHDRFREWLKAGVFQRMWQAGVLTYDELRTLVWRSKP
jgi:putative transposase